jgi:hypothetical protein
VPALPFPPVAALASAAAQAYIGADRGCGMTSKRNYSGVKPYAKVRGFRTVTAILPWAFIVAAFYHRPDRLQWGLRTFPRLRSRRGRAAFAAGACIEVVLREISGFVWIQITTLIILLRLALSAITLVWRFRRWRTQEK